MSRLLVFILLLGFRLFPLSNASTVQRGSQPVPPSEYPWYTAPHGYQKASPGSVPRIHPAHGNLTAVTGNCSAAYNIPYSSADVDASPSYTLTAGGYADIPTALGRGWIVNVPNFEGPLASLSLSITEGLAVLDSIRSILSLPLFNPHPETTRTALWGYSGGSIATTFALEFQATYAPELTLHGASLGGLLTSFITANVALNGSWLAGDLPPIYLGLTSQSSSARKLLLSSLHQNKASKFLAAENMSYFQDLPHYQYQDISSYFVNLTSFLLEPEIHQPTKNNWEIGWHGAPQVPLYVYKAMHDECVYVQYTDTMVNRWCELGVDVQYERNTIGGHEAEYYNGVGRSRKFLEWLLEGIAEGEEVAYDNWVQRGQCDCWYRHVNSLSRRLERIVMLNLLALHKLDE